jgi:hypothetical protein
MSMAADDPGWSRNDRLRQALEVVGEETGVDPVTMVYALTKATTRTPEAAALLTAPIENFDTDRRNLYDYMAHTMTSDSDRWRDAEQVLGIAWPTQIRLLFHGQAYSPLFAWDEFDQDDFEQDVRIGLGAYVLAERHQLPISQVRKLVAVFRGLQ